MPPGSGSSTRARPTTLLILAAAFFVARLATGVYESHRAVRPGGLVHWTTPDEAEASAMTERKPILYEFSAGWCEPCKQMEREVFSDPNSADFINRTFVAVRVTDEDRAGASEILRKRHHVDAMPTLVVAGGGSKDPRRIEGYPGKRRLLGFLKGAATTGRAAW